MNKTFTQKEWNATSKKNKKIDNPKVPAAKPSEHVINNILNFSKALSVTKSETIEHFEVVLN